MGICKNCKMYFSKLKHIFVQIEGIRQNCKMFLSKLGVSKLSKQIDRRLLALTGSLYLDCSTAEIFSRCAMERYLMH